MRENPFPQPTSRHEKRVIKTRIAEATIIMDGFFTVIGRIIADTPSISAMLKLHDP